MTPRPKTPVNACRLALLRGFRQSALQSVLDNMDHKGYVGEASQNLIDGVRLKDFEADLRQGDGNELDGKFRAAHSSSALAANTFAPFKVHPAALRLPVGDCFSNVRFERKCPHGLAGRRSPNLDVLADGLNGVVAVESKCLEILTPHVAEFAPAYEAEITDDRCRTTWFREMRRLKVEPRAYCWLDAAQLVKHAFGLAYGEFVNRRVILLYLYWEPSNPEAYPVFAEHRLEVTRFAESIAGDGPEFVALSYRELWNWWDTHPEPEWLPGHVGRLRRRYGVEA